MLSGCGKTADFLRPKKFAIRKYIVRQQSTAEKASSYAAMIYETIMIYNSAGNVYAHITANKWIYISAAATLGAAYLAYEYLPLKRWYDKTTKFFTQNADKGNQWGKMMV